MGFTDSKSARDVDSHRSDRLPEPRDFPKKGEKPKHKTRTLFSLFLFPQELFYFGATKRNQLVMEGHGIGRFLLHSTRRG